MSLQSLRRSGGCRAFRLRHRLSVQSDPQVRSANAVSVKTTRAASNHSHDFGSSRSQIFLDSITCAATTPIVEAKSDRAAYVRAEIDRLLCQKKYDTLLGVLAKWTSPASTSSWEEVITHRELSAILRQLVEYQVRLLNVTATHKTVNPYGNATRTGMWHVHDVREQLRSIYMNLLCSGDNTGQHLYGERRVVPQGMFKLSAADYENLITLELNNGKLDLASKWFQHMEAQYPSREYLEHMTHTLWLLKFEVYAGAKPSLWRILPTNYYEREINPRSSRFKSEKPWSEVLAQFSADQSRSSEMSSYIFDKKSLAVMMSSMAYSGHTSHVKGVIETNWGITSNGEMKAGFVCLGRDDPLYPDLGLLSTVVVSMLYNKEFVAGVVYINAFQKHYDVQLGSSSSKNFWDQLFRWSEVTTRYSEHRALQHYIKETNSSVVAGSPDSSEFLITLEQAKQSVDFDLEGYLKFTSDLKSQRVGLISELWKCYHESKPGFSARPYQTFLKLAQEYRSADMCYDLLQALLLETKVNSVSKDSYNEPMARGKLKTIHELYTNAMKTLISSRGENGRLGEISVIIKRWSLDDQMAHVLTKWATSNEQTYLQRMNESEIMQDAEDEESLLSLM